MAASKNLAQSPVPRKSPISKRGVLTIYGFGVRISMRSGHLEIEDGIGPERRTIRLARIGHGLKRLVCISEDGFATLSALKWLSDLDVPFVMLNRKGKVLFVTGPTASSDVRLRRAQALAHSSGVALRIARELIDKKLAGQEQVARYKLLTAECAEKIHCYRSELAEVNSIERLRLVESRAAAAYWSAWRILPISFSRKDQFRVPAHWRVYRAGMLAESARAIVRIHGTGRRWRNWLLFPRMRLSPLSRVSVVRCPDASLFHGLPVSESGTSTNRRTQWCAPERELWQNTRHST
jgi:hypothetical protein